MSQRKNVPKKSKEFNSARGSHRVTVIHSDMPIIIDGGTRNGSGRKQPYRINPETDEQRKKRLAARKALTLKAARMAYENHRRKTS